MRKVFLDELPKKGNKIDWNKSIGYKVKFVYDDIKDEMKIIDYSSSTRILKIKYNGNIFEIKTSGFINSNLGKILNKKTSNFKVDIGTNFANNKRNITIIDREYRTRIRNKNGKEYIEKEKWYKYKCNVCGWEEGWINESGLLKGIGCACCRGLIVVEGINDIPTTAPWMVKYFQGGYEEAKLYTRCSYKYINPVCPDCGKIKDKSRRINDIYHEGGISCICGDGIHFPEKFMYYLLKELNINFIFQLSKRNFEWCESKIYDFYLPESNSIIETHGVQHYQHTGFELTLKEVQNNDEFKKELALSNNINNYIIIDCRKTDLEWIKNSIINSKLYELFDLSNVNWIEIYKKSSNNLSKKVCEYYNTHKELTQKEIAEIFNIKYGLVRKYIQKGKKYGWCSSENRKRINNIYKNSKKILCVELNEIFNSLTECANILTERFGYKFDVTCISRVIKGKQKTHNGFTFKFV